MSKWRTWKVTECVPSNQRALSLNIIQWGKCVCRWLRRYQCIPLHSHHSSSQFTKKADGYGHHQNHKKTKSDPLTSEWILVVDACGKLTIDSLNWREIFDQTIARHRKRTSLLNKCFCFRKCHRSVAAVSRIYVWSTCSGLCLSTSSAPLYSFLRFIVIFTRANLVVHALQC